MLTIYSNHPGKKLVRKQKNKKLEKVRERLATKYNPNQHSRSKRVEKLHRLKSHPISLEAFRTEQREPFDFPTGISGFPK